MQNRNLPDTAALFDHTRFVTLRDELLALFDNAADDVALDAQLETLLQHMRAQFAAEEIAMEEAQFPPRAAHKRDHDGALADFSRRIAHWRVQGERAGLLEYVEMDLADRFVKHVNTRDYITARFLGGARDGFTKDSPDCPSCG